MTGLAVDVASLDLFSEFAVHADEVELRPMLWSELTDYALLVCGGLFAPGEPATLGPWFLPDNLPASARNAVAWQLMSWAQLTPDDWAMDFGVFVEGRLLGAQLVRAEGFLQTREVSTGSLLAPQIRGRGYGKKARVAALHLAFDVFGAESAVTVSRTWNAASQAVSRSLGYDDEGVGIEEVLGVEFEVQRYRMSRQRWSSLEKPWSLSVTGAGPVLDAIGLHATA